MTSVDRDAGFRTADAAALTVALQATRADTLATFAAVERSGDGLVVPQRATVNPPLWELGHLGWFQEFWTSRNPQRRRGIDADPDVARLPGVRVDADALYDSSRVAHATRWSLPLPDAAGTRDDLARQLERTLASLDGADDASLYFHRLVVAHEDMHHEAALYTARHLGIALDRGDARWSPRRLDDANPALHFDAGSWTLGHDGPGFAFDNELACHAFALPDTQIDARVVRWTEYLPFVEAGGYRSASGWSDAGRAWLSTERPDAPRYLRRGPHGWERRLDDAWTPLDLAEAACHLTRFEAEAWCRWAGRRLPSEGEWERAAVTRSDAARDAFAWGEVWEWTASDFAAYPGFVAHPYRDYSAPWFATPAQPRAVLRGASFMTQPRMRHPRYRNFFPPDRSDVAAGFRSCAVSAAKRSG